MAILIKSKGEYRNTYAIDRLTNYVLNPKRTPSHCYGGNGVDLSNPAESMKKMKYICDQTTGKQAI